MWWKTIYSNFKKYYIKRQIAIILLKILPLALHPLISLFWALSEAALKALFHGYLYLHCIDSLDGLHEFHVCFFMALLILRTSWNHKLSDLVNKVMRTLQNVFRSLLFPRMQQLSPHFWLYIIKTFMEEDFQKCFRNGMSMSDARGSKLGGITATWLL